MGSFWDFRVLLLGIILVGHNPSTTFGFSLTRKNGVIGEWKLFSSFGSSSQRRPPSKISMIGTGFSFEDGEQILVSVQKPMGMVLEQDEDDATILVTELDPLASAAKAGVQVGDVLVAVQNASVEQADLDSVLDFIQKGPRVMNLRFQRQEED